MNNDLKTNISGGLAIVALILNHYVGFSIPDWILNLVAAVLAAHFVYLTNKKDKAPQAKDEPVKVQPPINQPAG